MKPEHITATRMLLEELAGGDDAGVSHAHEIHCAYCNGKDGDDGSDEGVFFHDFTCPIHRGKVLLEIIKNEEAERMDIE